MSDSVAELTASLGALLAESEALRADAATAEKSRRRLVKIVIALLSVGVVLLAAVGIMTAATLGVSNTIACYTTEGERCYEESQEQSRELIQRILNGQVAASECAGTPDVRACFNEHLADDSGG